MKRISKSGTKAYSPPMIEISNVTTEHSIAAGSAAVIPVNSASQVQKEWETGQDVSVDQLW